MTSPLDPSGGPRRVALVTGSSRGIGRGAALALAEAGFSVAVHGRQAGERLAEAEAAVAAAMPAGAGTLAVAFDVADLAAQDAALDRVEAELGPLTTLVNNAGVGVLSRGDPLEVSEASWDHCLDTNAKAMFFLTQNFARRLLARARSAEEFCSIINVTSANAVAVAEPRAEYCASKAAAAMVSKGWAVRLGRENVAVYDLQPGLIRTDLTAPVLRQYEARARDGLTLFPRIGTPAEMGRIVAMLASGGLPYTTGLPIAADAGMLVSRF